MKSLLLKEINVFFSGVIGYLVIIVFLALNGIFLWLFPGQFNLLNSGYANIDGLFLISPWMLMLLIPAITMRMFADEKKSGTIELLLTRPFTDFQIVFAKYLSAVALVVFSLIPTFIYFYTVYQLGNPVGNIDTGGTLGSYVGLLFLGASYAAIGLFTSSITDNQVISFIASLLICFFFYFGFDHLAGLDFFGNFDLVILSLGMNEHYASMSRGVINLVDATYFLSVITLFLLATRTVLKSRKW
ncbi:MAG: gliding motility-associated ABC transporter permease subunit GldF [Schleiferiaceae bacterium]|jgi:ABC-2 type transport system permease protein|nr:gliding motility-associated ABC transporter permease subunit GldF [Schleiferiaceae bacterium]